MRIAYIAPYLDSNTLRGGVGGKIRSQIGTWKQHGHDSRLFILSPDKIVVERVDVFPYRASTQLPILGSLSRTVSRSRAFSQLIRAVREYRPDVIYMRLGRYTFVMQELFAVAPVVVEINSDDINESRHIGFPVYWFNRLTRGFLLKNASGLVAVSREIANLPQNKMYRSRVCIIANGISLERYEPLPAPGNEKPVIALVGSPGMIWHGVDKLVRLARHSADLTIKVAGYNPSDIGGELPPNLYLLGFLDQDGVTDVLRTSDVACGSLALHRNGMREASPLKVREAVAYGLPVILAYDDTDLADLEHECILHIPNTEDNVETHAEKIRSFAYRMMGKRIPRGLIENRIGHRQKELERMAFLEEIAQLGK